MALPVQANPSDVFNVSTPHWSVGTVAYNSIDSTYTATYYPEKKDRYDMYAKFVFLASDGVYATCVLSPRCMHFSGRLICAFTSSV